MQKVAEALETGLMVLQAVERGLVVGFLLMVLYSSVITVKLVTARHKLIDAQRENDVLRAAIGTHIEGHRPSVPALRVTF